MNWRNVYLRNRGLMKRKTITLSTSVSIIRAISDERFLNLKSISKNVRIPKSQERRKLKNKVDYTQKCSRRENSPPFTFAASPKHNLLMESLDSRPERVEKRRSHKIPVQGFYTSCRSVKSDYYCRTPWNKNTEPYPFPFSTTTIHRRGVRLYFACLFRIKVIR